MGVSLNIICIFKNIIIKYWIRNWDIRVLGRVCDKGNDRRILNKKIIFLFFIVSS